MNKRRRLLALLAFAPPIAWAQSTVTGHRIGILSAGYSPKAKDHPNWPSFFASMQKLGYEEGRNVTYEVREAGRTPDRAADAFRIVDQPEDRQGAWRRHSANRATARRAGDRVAPRELMSDTSPEVEAILDARYAAMTGSERALMAMQMFETAQQIVLSSLDPGLGEYERKRELCRRRGDRHPWRLNRAGDVLRKTCTCRTIEPYISGDRP